MIIWRGWGFLVAVFAFGASLAMELITESITRDDSFYQKEAWPLALAFAVAGVVTWFIGKALHARGGRALIDKATGQELTLDASHTFFFVPMHYWGMVLIALAGAVLVWSFVVSDVVAAQRNHPATEPPALPGLTIIAPAAPGAGWDQLAREMQREIERQALTPNVRSRTCGRRQALSASHNSSTADAAMAGRCSSTAS